jgi:hypothetical protein
MGLMNEEYAVPWVNKRNQVLDPQEMLLAELDKVGKHVSTTAVLCREAAAEIRRLSAVPSPSELATAVQAALKLAPKMYELAPAVELLMFAAELVKQLREPGLHTET